LCLHGDALKELSMTEGSPTVMEEPDVPINIGDCAFAITEKKYKNRLNKKVIFFIITYPRKDKIILLPGNTSLPNQSCGLNNQCYVLIQRSHDAHAGTEPIPPEHYNIAALYIVPAIDQ
jgi:hypothetical protein